MRASYLGDGDGRLRDVLDAARGIAGATRLHVPGCQHPDNRTETDEISNEIRDACRSPQKEIIENKAMGPEYWISFKLM